MTTPPLFPGFDGLMTLSRREGVDIRPTLLRVLTDLYVQASAHSADEERQFIELTSRLIDEVDDATRAAVRARLAIYPGTPAEILGKLGIRSAAPDLHAPLAYEIADSTPPAASPACRIVPEISGGDDGGLGPYPLPVRAPRWFRRVRVRSGPPAGSGWFPCLREARHPWLSPAAAMPHPPEIQ